MDYRATTDTERIADEVIANKLLELMTHRNAHEIDRGAKQFCVEVREWAGDGEDPALAVGIEQHTAELATINAKIKTLTTKVNIGDDLLTEKLRYQLEQQMAAIERDHITRRSEADMFAAIGERRTAEQAIAEMILFEGAHQALTPLLDAMDPPA